MKILQLQFLFSGFKLAKYDRGPSSNAPNPNDKVKVGATGRTFWSPQMLQTLQETRSTAQTIVARSGREISLTKGKNHAFKRYDHFPLFWNSRIIKKVVCSTGSSVTQIKNVLLFPKKHGRMNGPKHIQI